MIEAWFPTLIYNENINDFEKYNSILEKRAYELHKKFRKDFTTEWHCDTFNTINKSCFLGNSDDQIIEDFIEATKSKVKIFGDEFCADFDNLNINLTDIWFNISKPGNFQEFHQHPNNHFSVVYYVKTPKDSGDIIFRNINSLFDNFIFPVKENTFPNFASVRYKPIETKMLIFKSNIPHMVTKNESTEDRISIAMNFKLEAK